MKQQFDTHHGAKSRFFVPGQSVLIQLSNGQRIPGTIVKLIGKAIACVSIEGGFINRHVNQIWNRSLNLRRKSDDLNEDLLPAQPNSKSNIPQDPEEAEQPPSNAETQVPEEAEPPGNAVTQVPGPTIRRSDSLSHQSRPDYKGTRQYRR